MRLMMILLLLGGLIGCEATAVRSSEEVTTSNKLNPQIASPVQVPVAIYVDKSKPDKQRTVNFYAILEEAAELVGDGLFESSELLSSKSEFQYLLSMSAFSTWNRAWGIWNAELELIVLSRDGRTLFTGTFKSSESGGLYDSDAIYNSLAEAAKESIIGFLNHQGPETIELAVNEYRANPIDKLPVKELLADLPPSGSGSGFFVDEEGMVLTAAHVVADCVHVEMQHKGELMAGEVKHSSQLLDLAVIKTGFANSTYGALSTDTKPVLGKQVFVTGYPLAGILSDYPSLTVGNVSSIGGLKGATGTFQFSAPIQPGNSGGAIVDYKGNVVGLVSSSLNQAMMLEKVGTVSQNVNFGIQPVLIQKFLQHHNVVYQPTKRNNDFEQASADAVEYTVQVLCYK